MKSIVSKLYRSLLSYETRFRLYKWRHRDQLLRERTSVYEHPKGKFSLKPYDENRCIFVHITKTAGTAVATALYGYLPYHYTAIDYRVIYGRRDFDAYYKFAFARNPWDRLYSAWRYLKAGGWDEKDREWYEQHLSAYTSFDSFIKGWLQEDRLNQHMHFWPQHSFICDEAGRPLIDELFYFETLCRDYEAVRTRLGIGSKLRPRNATPGEDYRDVYNEETRAIVAEVYAKDIELLGYNFDGIVKRQGRLTGNKQIP